ncbi:MAG: PGPGW domain-containing protein [bacterium]|nr:PGPGW domain-containing protein [bacterium]
MNREIKRALVLSAGVIFLILGVVGLGTPFLQGILFIAIGLTLLSIASVKARRWIELHTKRFPRIQSVVQKIEKQLNALIGGFRD